MIDSKIESHVLKKQMLIERQRTMNKLRNSKAEGYNERLREMEDVKEKEKLHKILEDVDVRKKKAKEAKI